MYPHHRSGKNLLGLIILILICLMPAAGALSAAGLEVTPDTVAFGNVYRNTEGNLGNDLAVKVTSVDYGYAVTVSATAMTGIADPACSIAPSQLKTRSAGEEGWLSLSDEQVQLLEAAPTGSSGRWHTLNFSLDIPDEVEFQEYRGALVLNVTTLLPSYEISIRAEPLEGGAVTGAGSYRAGENVTVSAAPNLGYRFLNWSENSTSLTADSSYTFLALGNRNLTANFAPLDKVASYWPAYLTIQNGIIESGSANSLHHLDQSSLVVKSSPNGTNAIAWYSSFFVHVPAASIKEMGICYAGRCSHTTNVNDEHLSLYNFQENKFEVIVQRPVSTDDQQSAWVTEDPAALARYISAEGEVRFRIYNSAYKSVGVFKRFSDYARLEIKYAPDKPNLTLAPLEVSLDEFNTTVSAGSPADMAAADGSCFTVNSGDGNKAAWITGWSPGIPREKVAALTVTYCGKWSVAANPLWLSLWDWDAAAWEVVINGPSSTIDQQWVWTGTGTGAQKYLSDSGEIKCRVYNSAAQPFQRYTDQLNLYLEFER